MTSLSSLRSAALAGAAASLVDTTAAARLHAVPDPFGDVFTWLGLECRLHDDPQVDLMVCVPRGARAALVGRCGSWPDAWSQGREVARRWADPRSALGAVPYLWFEMDLPRRPDGPDRLIPFVPFEASVASVPDPSTVLPIAADAVDDAWGLSRFVSAVAALPAGAWPLHVASMSARGTRSIRFVATVPIASIDRWLIRVGWTGSLDAVRSVLPWVGAGHSHTSVAIEIGPDGIGPRLGLDAFHTADPSTDRRWRVVLDGLSTLPGVSEDRLRGFVAWADLGGVSGWERVPHVKVLVDGARLGAKAYLAIERASGR